MSEVYKTRGKRDYTEALSCNYTHGHTHTHTHILGLNSWVDKCKERVRFFTVEVRD